MSIAVVLVCTAALVSDPSSFKFAGGTDADLVKSLQAHFGGSVVLLASPMETWPKASFSSSSHADSLRLLRTKLGLLQTPVAGTFAPTAWPDGLYRRYHFERYQGRFKPVPLTDTFEDGKLSLRTQESQALALDDLPKLAMTKPVEFHRCFHGAPLRVDLRGITEDRFVESVAAALGGVVVDRKGITFIDVNPKEYASRALAYWTGSARLAEKRRDHVEAADADYMIKLLPAIPASLIKKALDDPQNDYGLPFGQGTPVFEAAWKRVRVYAAKNTASANQVQSTFERFVDPRQPVYGLIDPGGNPSAAFYNKEQNRRVQF